jgi:dihydrofolate reductase
MPKLRVHNYTMSVDGYAAGPNQSLENPMGEGAEALHPWMIATAFGQTMFGNEGGSTGVDNDFAQGFGRGIGAYIMGRNMFGPIRGPWESGEEWKGWWGPNPPYHCDVFVLTHYPRPSLEMDGDNTFHFVQDDIHTVLDHAFEAAGGLDVQVGGGASTVRQYLRAGLIDELNLAISPILLGSGERLFDDETDAAAAGYTVTQTVAGEGATHVRLERTESLERTEGAAR